MSKDQSAQIAKALTGLDYYDSSIKETDLKVKKIKTNRAIRQGAVLLLSEYKPKEFGND